MKLIEEILEYPNIMSAVQRVKSNKGASGIDNMSVDEIDSYFKDNYETIVNNIKERKYQPLPVRRVYIPKSNGKLRPLGIPTVIDRVIQQAIAQILVPIYEPIFSDYSFGFRPERDCHKAMDKALEYINDGYDFIIDFDIKKYFDTVNHDKLISILREHVFDSDTLHLIRLFLKAGIMEDGLISPSEEGVPQGGPLSPVLSNIYLDKLDKELEERGLRFVRYADDFDIFVKSKKSAKRVKESIIWWLERKLFLEVSEEKTVITKPNGSEFLGFTYWKNKDNWRVKPLKSRKQKLEKKIKEITLRKKAIARPLGETFTKINQVVIGWINYYKIGDMKGFLKRDFGPWLRHKVRVIILKQWKKRPTIYKNLCKINRITKANIQEERIYSIANARQGLYRMAMIQDINYLISPKLLATSNKEKNRPGLVDPYRYYLSKLEV